MLEVVEGACRLDHLVAATEWSHGVVGEYERIKLGIEAVDSIALNEKHRFACADEVDKELFVKVVATQHFVVPSVLLDVETLNPDADIFGAGVDEVDVVSVVDECAVGTKVFDGVPDSVEYRGVEEEGRRVDENHRIGHGVEHGCDVVEHRFLTRTQFNRRDNVLA